MALSDFHVKIAKFKFFVVERSGSQKIFILILGAADTFQKFRIVNPSLTMLISTVLNVETESLIRYDGTKRIQYRSRRVRNRPKTVQDIERECATKPMV